MLNKNYNLSYYNLNMNVFIIIYLIKRKLDGTMFVK